MQSNIPALPVTTWRCERSWIAALLVLLALTGLAMLASASAPVEAQAHDACIHHGDDVGCGRKQCCSPAYYVVDGCDRESDGNRVRAHFQGIDAAFTLYYGQWDPNGANSGCAHDYAWITTHRICEESVGCSGWVVHNTGSTPP